LADQVTRGAPVVAVRQHGRRARVNAELVLERYAMHVVARAKRAIGADEELRNEEQRNAFDAFRGRRRARKHEVNDVVGKVMLTERDEDLLPEELVGAVALRNGAR